MAHMPIQNENPLPPLRRRYIRAAMYTAMVLLAFLLQTTPRLLPSVAGGRILMMVPLTVYAAFYIGPAGGASVGIACGFLWDMGSVNRLLGFHVIVLMVMGCAAGLLLEKLLRNNILTAMLLAASAITAQGIIDWVFHFVLLQKPEALYQLTHTVLPSALLTFVISPLVYYGVSSADRLLRWGVSG